MEDKTKSAERQGVSLSYGALGAILVTVGAYIASDVITGLALSLTPLFTGWNKIELNRWLETSVLAQFLTVLLIAISMLGLIAIFVNSRKVKWAQLGLVLPRYRDVVYALLGYGVYFMAFIAVSQIAANLIPSLNLEQEQEVLFNKGTTGAALWLVFASLVVLPPIIEEIAFRGFLYSGLRRSLPKVVAAIITSILFAIAHLQIGSGNALLWVAALDTFILSMILVYIREKTGSLAGSILVHFMKNTLAFVFLFLLRI